MCWGYVRELLAQAPSPDWALVTVVVLLVLDGISTVLAARFC